MGLSEMGLSEMGLSEKSKAEVNEGVTRPSGKKPDPGVWKRMMRNYAFAMVAGIALLTYLMPNLHNDAGPMMLGAMLVGGLLLFAGGFGVVVSLFFYYLNKNK